MKELLSSCLLLAVCLFSASEVSAKSLDYALDPSSSIIEYDVKSTAHSFTGSVQAFESKIVMRDDQQGIQQVIVTVPVMQMTTNHKARDEDMLKMFESNLYPNIYFKSKEVSRIEGPKDVFLVGTFSVKGTLRIRNIERDINFDLKSEMSNGNILASGEIPLDIRWFDLKPPTTLFGLIRVKKHITLRFTTQWKKVK